MMTSRSVENCRGKMIWAINNTTRKSDTIDKGIKVIAKNMPFLSQKGLSYH